MVSHCGHIKYVQNEKETSKELRSQCPSEGSQEPSLQAVVSSNKQPPLQEALTLPCFSWKARPPPARWSMTETQEAGLYKVLQVGRAGVER